MTETTAVRDALLALLQTIQVARGWTAVRRTAVAQLDEADCPVCTILIGDDNAQADDEAVMGPPHFLHETAYHISVLRNFAPGEALDDAITADIEAVQNLILRSPGFNATIEGITSMRTSRVFPTGDSGTYFAEMRLELVVQYRTLWQPDIHDDLLGIDVVSRQAGLPDSSPPNRLTINLDPAP